MKAASVLIVFLFLSASQILAAGPTPAPKLPVAARRPTQAALLKAVKLPVMLGGKQSGWVDVPNGTLVGILDVRKKQVLVGMADSQAWVNRSDTDFDKRLASFKLAKNDAAAKVQQARTAQNAATQEQNSKATADFQAKHADYANPLDKGAYDQRRSVVDYYDWQGRRYHIGPYGERIYQ